MISIKKQQSLVVQAVTMAVVLLLSVPLFRWVTPHLAAFVWPWSPWEHWYGWIAYAIVWIYAAILFAISWVGQYVMWFSPLAAISMAYETRNKRRQLMFDGYKKTILFQTRKLAETWREGNSFGNHQLKAFLNVVHLALCAGMSRKDIQLWVLKGFRQGSGAADQILDACIFEVLYPSEDSSWSASLPELWVDGKPCLVH